MVCQISVFFFDINDINFLLPADLFLLQLRTLKLHSKSLDQFLHEDMLLDACRKYTFSVIYADSNVYIKKVIQI